MWKARHHIEEGRKVYICQMPGLRGKALHQVQNMIFVKEHIHNNRKLLAICDGNLIGKIFEEGDKILNVSKNFYHGEPMFEKDILKLIEDNILLNIVGDESIKFALKNELIDKKGIIRIKNIPHAMLL